MNEEQRSEEQRRQEREEAEEAAYRAAEEAAVARRAAIRRAQSATLITCIEAFDRIGAGTFEEDLNDVSDARDRVLRALNSAYFELPPSPMETLSKNLSEMLPQIIQAWTQAMGAGTGQVGAVRVEYAQAADPAVPQDPAPATDDPMGATRVKQYWDQVAPSLTADELRAVIMLAMQEIDNRRRPAP